jgi:hypothetical protein
VIPWLKIAGGVAVFAFLFYALHTIKKWEDGYHELQIVKPQLVQYQAAYAKAQADAIDAAVKDGNERTQLSTELEAERQAAEQLRLSFGKIKTVIEVRHEGSCPTQRLSDAYGLCFSAAVSGDPAARAACEANRGYGPR